MAQPHMVNMAAMGGPVGGPVGTPAVPTTWTTEQQLRKLNTAIYEYMLHMKKYELARNIYKELQIDTTTDVKRSPKNQANGINGDMDLDSKDHAKRPDDLPAPDLDQSQGEYPFLQDWWCSFWDMFKGARGSGKQNMLAYVGTQRHVQKMRQMGGAADPNALNGMRAFPANMAADNMRMQVMRTQMKPGMQPRPGMPGQPQANQMQASGMERQGSTMNMNDARNSGSPNPGDSAPSPKRLRTEGSMTQLNQARQGQPQNTQSIGEYSSAMRIHSANALQNSNVMKGLPQNPAMGGPGVAQPNVMGQPLSESGDFYANTNRIPVPNGNGPGQQVQQQNGNHALQDYQMQLMLLEQQNKKRLLMARQEQDNHGVPSAAIGGADPSAMMPGSMNPALRGLINSNANNQMRPPPSSHPIDMQLMQQRVGSVMQNGFSQPQPGPGQMMPQQPGQAPNMTPRQGNMAPPPAPAGVNAAAANPSSPAQPPPPPTPSQNKSGKGTKKDAKNNKPAAGKKGANAAATESAEAPPTPTPPPPVTPNNANSFNPKNGSIPNGQPAAPVPPNQNITNGLNNGQAPSMQTTSDLGMPFGDLGGGEFGSMDFANLETGDVLDNFDFDSFLNSDQNTSGDFPFDANLAFGDPGIETDLQ